MGGGAPEAGTWRRERRCWLRLPILRGAPASARAWLACSPGDRGEPRVFGEFLSDIAEAKAGGVLVVTQVKYTQSSGMVISALGDLFRIYQVAAKATPALLPRLDLCILSAQPDLKNVAGTIARWQPQGVAPADPLLTDFRARVRADIRADSEDELLAVLANELSADRPLATAQRWLGRLPALAFDWLDAAMAQPDWSEVWMALWAGQRDRDQLRALAERWLATNPRGAFVVRSALGEPASKRVRRRASTRDRKRGGST